MQTIKAKGGHLDKKNTVKTMMALLKNELSEFVIVIMIVNTLEYTSYGKMNIQCLRSFVFAPSKVKKIHLEAWRK